MLTVVVFLAKKTLLAVFGVGFNHLTFDFSTMQKKFEYATSKHPGQFQLAISKRTQMATFPHIFPQSQIHCAIWAKTFSVRCGTLWAGQHRETHNINSRKYLWRT